MFPSKIGWDLIPTDPVTRKLRKLLLDTNVERAPFKRGSNRWSPISWHVEVFCLGYGLCLLLGGGNSNIFLFLSRSLGR